jgi:hypothetical protein
MQRYHGRTIREWAFQVGDLVLRRVQSNKDRHKLSPPWEGPIIVDQVLRLGTYKLKDGDGQPITNAGTSNIYVVSTLKEKESFHVSSRKDSLVFPL